jgi:hypothetical protein
MKAMQSLAPAKVESLPIEATKKNVSRANIALNTKKVCECTEEEIKAKLTLIYSLVGLRPQHYPIGQEKIDLHNYIVLKFGQKTLGELVLAFDLAISCELELTRDEVKVYDQFTISYIANIMAAYRKWLKSVSDSVEPEKCLLVEEKKELTKIDYEEWLQSVKHYPVELIPIILYDYLVRENLVNYTTDEKLGFLNIAVKLYLISIEEDRVETKNFLKQKEQGYFTEPYNTKLKDLAKKIAVKKYLNK